MFCIMNVTVVHFGHFVYEYPGRLLLIYVLQVAIVIVAAYAGNGLYFRINPPQHCLIITDRGENAADLVKKVGRFKKQYRIEGIAYYDQEDITALIDGCDAVFLYNLEPVKRSRIVSYCYQNWKVIYYSIEPEDVVSLGSQRLLFDDKSMICASSRELTFEQRILKRLMDIIVSAVGLVIASPIMLVTALAISSRTRPACSTGRSARRMPGASSRCISSAPCASRTAASTAPSRRTTTASPTWGTSSASSASTSCRS